MPSNTIGTAAPEESRFYEDTLAQATTYLRLALPLMAKHEVINHPNNIALWYDYVSGGNQALKQAMDEFLKQKKPITESVCRDLYRRFFVQDDPALEQMRQELRRIVLEVHQEVGQAGGNLSRYSDILERFATLLGSEADLDISDADVDQMIVETQETEQSHRDLQGRLGNVVAEVEALRKELEQIREESLTDGLTGISNRKAFDSALEQTISISADKKTPVCVVIADIDRFKRFNDSYGHLIGDRVLRFVATTLKRCVKGHDRPARFGGEEFSIILPNTTLIGARSVAEQIRKEVSLGVLKEKGSEKSYGKITISIGVAQYRNGESMNDLIERADRALYRAKRKGRNRVEQAS